MVHFLPRQSAFNGNLQGFFFFLMCVNEFFLTNLKKNLSFIQAFGNPSTQVSNVLVLH